MPVSSTQLTVASGLNGIDQFFAIPGQVMNPALPTNTPISITAIELGIRSTDPFSYVFVGNTNFSGDINSIFVVGQGSAIRYWQPDSFLWDIRIDAFHCHYLAQAQNILYILLSICYEIPSLAL